MMSHFHCIPVKIEQPKIGEGQTWDSYTIFKNIICDPDMQNIPIILETPNDNTGYEREIALLQKICS